MPKAKKDNALVIRTPTQAAFDRGAIADLMYQGHTRNEITEVLNKRENIDYLLSTKSVDEGIKRLRKDLFESTLVKTDLAIKEQLIRLQFVEREAWIAWRKSKAPVEEKKVIENLRAYFDYEDGEKRLKEEKMVVETIERYVRKGVGDRLFLEIILKAIAERSKLLSLNTQKIKLDLKKEETIHVKTYHVIDPAMWDDPRISVRDQQVIVDGEFVDPEQLMSGKDNGKDS